MQSDIPKAQGAYEELYVNVSADTYEKVDAAVALIELLLTPVSVSFTVLKILILKDFQVLYPYEPFMFFSGYLGSCFSKFYLCCWRPEGDIFYLYNDSRGWC